MPKVKNRGNVRAPSHALRSSDAYKSAQRLGDIVADASFFENVSAPRSFSLTELNRLAEDMYNLEGTIASLANFLETHSVQATPLGNKTVTTESASTSEAESSVYFAIMPAEGKTVTLGNLTISDSEVVEHLVKGFPKSSATYHERMNRENDFKLTFPQGGSLTLKLSPYELMAFLKYLPGEMYRASGSLLEQLAGHFFKSAGDGTGVTYDERAAFLRTQDKTIKTAVEMAARADVVGPYGKLMGPLAYNGTIEAREHSPSILRLIAPSVYSWLYDGKALGQPIVG